LRLHSHTLHSTSFTFNQEQYNKKDVGYYADDPNLFKPFCVFAFFHPYQHSHSP
jgi:hypothetical protein